MPNLAPFSRGRVTAPSPSATTSGKASAPYRLSKPDHNGAYIVLHPSTGKPLGRVERAYRGGGASWRYVPLVDGRLVDEPYKTVKAAALRVVHVAARARSGGAR